MLKRGFTIVEIIMVILIIAIISIVATADIINSTASAKLEGARWKLKSDLSYAQSLAVTQTINHGIIFSPETETYFVYRQTTSNIVTHPSTGYPFTVNYSTDSTFRGVDITSVNFGNPNPNQVEFNNLGTPSNGVNPLTVDGTITLTYRGTTAIVTVTRNTGKIN